MLGKKGGAKGCLKIAFQNASSSSRFQVGQDAALVGENDERKKMKKNHLALSYP